MQDVFQKISASRIRGRGFRDGSGFAHGGLALLICTAATCASTEPIHVIKKVVPNRN